MPAPTEEEGSGACKILEFLTEKVVRLSHTRVGGDGVPLALLPLPTITTASQRDRRKERLGVLDLEKVQGVSPVAPFLLLGVLASQDTHLSAHPHPSPPPARGHQLVVVSQRGSQMWCVVFKNQAFKNQSNILKNLDF